MTDVDRPLVDRTGLTGRFDFFLEWTPQMAPSARITPEAQDAPNFVEALRKQLGIELQPATGSVETFLVDHVEKPTPN